MKRKIWSDCADFLQSWHLAKRNLGDWDVWPWGVCPKAGAGEEMSVRRTGACFTSCPLTFRDAILKETVIGTWGCQKNRERLRNGQNKLLRILSSPPFCGMICLSLSLNYFQFGSVQSLSRVRLFATPWIAARQASLSIINSRSSPRLTSIKSVMPSSHLILSSPSPPAPNPSQHQSLFQWVNYFTT